VGNGAVAKMQYIEAPDETQSIDFNSVFLAGGITNCRDWQKDLADRLKQESVTLFNPRRADFPMGDPNAARQQIEWEYRRLRQADIISFWFATGSPNPIVLFELGAALERDQRLIIGCSPGYERTQDVIIQTELRRPDLKVIRSFDEMPKAIIDEIDRFEKPDRPIR
jgi:hypothetical protein